MLVHRTEFVRQSDDLIVYAPLNRKPMKLLQSLGDADASPLTSDNMSERALQTLKPRNVLNRDPHKGRVGVIEAAAVVGSYQFWDKQA